MVQEEEVKEEKEEKEVVKKEKEEVKEEEKEVDGTRYMLGHTRDYVKVALPAGERAGELQSNRVVRCIAQGFLTDEILLGELCS